MPTYHSYTVTLIDRKALEAYVRSRGLTPKDGKWLTVCARVRHRFVLK